MLTVGVQCSVSILYNHRSCSWHSNAVRLKETQQREQSPNRGREGEKNCQSVRHFSTGLRRGVCERPLRKYMQWSILSVCGRAFQSLGADFELKKVLASCALHQHSSGMHKHDCECEEEPMGLLLLRSGLLHQIDSYGPVTFGCTAIRGKFKKNQNTWTTNLEFWVSHQLVLRPFCASHYSYCTVFWTHKLKAL